MKSRAKPLTNAACHDPTTKPKAANNVDGSKAHHVNIFRSRSSNIQSVSVNGTHETARPSPATVTMQPAQPAPHVPQKPSRNPIHPSVVHKLDPAFLKLYNDYIAPGPPPSTELHTLRSNYSALYSYATAPATGVGGIGETTVPGWEKYPGDINVRVYVPPGEDLGIRKVWPVHFNFHGGGWAVGDLETSAHICHHICAHVPCCVIDIEYRLIPEYPFPIGIMDGLSAIAHILVNHKTFSIDPHHITFGGESSGATIALVMSHMFRDAGEAYASRVKGVVVGTPTISDVRNYSTPGESPFESMRENEFAPLLDWQKLKWFDTYKWMSLSQQPPFQQDRRHTRDNVATPPDSRRPSYREMTRDISWYTNLLAAPDFKNLAPHTWIGTAEIDPMRDEAEAYAEKLRENGNKVVTKRYLGVPHPFMHMDGVLRQGRDYVNDVISNIKQCLYPPEGTKLNDEREGSANEMNLT